MTQPVNLFDRALLKSRRERIFKQTKNKNYDYLLRYAANDIVDRTTLIKRNFPLVLNYGCHTGLLSQLMNELETMQCVISTDTVEECAQTAPRPATICDEELFPFANESFDLIVSALTLQWINDLPGTLRQIRNGLKPDGVFIAATLGSQSLCELRHCFLTAEEELYGGASPRVAPFVDVKDLGHLLQRAGFNLPVTDRDVLPVRYANAMQLMQEIKKMGAGNNLTNRHKAPSSRALFERVNELYHENFSDSDGRITATFEIVFLMGWAPHPDQQKPLRPGSGKVSLTNLFEGN